MIDEYTFENGSKFIERDKKEIVLNDRTADILRNMAKTIIELQGKIQLICNIILNENNIEDTNGYVLTSDCTRIIKEDAIPEKTT